VMPAGPQPKQLAIEHVRNGRERVPVLRVDMGEGPPDALPAQPAVHVRILQDVKRIVVIDELVVECLSKDNPDEREDADADQ
jgi:hypothetical protein